MQINLKNIINKNKNNNNNISNKLRRKKLKNFINQLQQFELIKAIFEKKNI